MAKFPSTLLPNSNEVTEIRKAILDLLDKINTVAPSAPVPAEPSLGTLHPHNAVIINAANPGGAGWSTVNISAEVPAGTKVIYCRLEIRASVAGEFVIMADTSARAGAFELIQWTQLANGPIDIYGYLTLSPTRTFDWYASGVNLSVVDAIMQGYLG